MDLLRVVLAKLPLQRIIELRDGTAGNEVFNEDYLRTRARMVNRFDKTDFDELVIGQETILDTFDRYVRICVIQGELFDGAHVFMGVGALRVRALAIGDARRYLLFSDLNPTSKRVISEIDYALLSGIPEVQAQMFACIEANMFTWKSFTTSMSLFAMLAVDLETIQWSETVSKIFARTIVDLKNESRGIHNIIDSENVFRTLGYLRQPACDEDLYRSGRERRDGTIVKVIGRSNFRRILLNFDVKSVENCLANEEFDVSAIDILPGYQPNIQLTLSTVNRAWKLLSFERKYDFRYHEDFRLLFLIITGQRIERPSGMTDFYSILMISVAHPQVIEQDFAKLTSSSSTKSQVHYDIVNLFKQGIVDNMIYTGDYTNSLYARGRLLDIRECKIFDYFVKPLIKKTIFIRIDDYPKNNMNFYGSKFTTIELTEYLKKYNLYDPCPHDLDTVSIEQVVSLSTHYGKYPDPQVVERVRHYQKRYQEILAELHAAHDRPLG